jgi:dTDP-4-amino-4,6-dideoxygalactose transaminase
MAVFHYLPLHESVTGKEYGEFHGSNKNTTKDSVRLLRLPIWYDLDISDARKIVDYIIEFYKK